MKFHQRVLSGEFTGKSVSLGSALAGLVASTIRYVLKDVLSGATSGEFTIRSLDTIRGQIATDKGLGRPAILAVIGTGAGHGGGAPTFLAAARLRLGE